MECAKDSATLAIFTTSPVECRDEYDERYERCYKLVRGLTDGVSEKDAHDALNTNNARGAQAHEDAAVGLLVSILSSSDSASTKFRDLTLTSRDGMAAVISQLQFLVVEKYGRLQDAARQQLLWLLRQLIRNSVNGTDGVCWNLMRQIVGGDISPKNVWLAESLLDIFIENRSWLEKHQFLTASVVYCYLRIIEDHFPPQFQQLREKEAGFIVQLLRERFADCIIIGRDLVRLLQHVARVPRIDALWRDLLHNPTVLMPNFTGLLQLLQSRTSRRFLPCRLTPDMEKKIVFLTSHVRFGSQKRYQEWFQKQYLSTPESQSLRCDLIRFIVGVIHPTNELLSSDIIPRWAVIGWLLTTCTSQVALANAKLALFFDWLFYDAEKDNIMNIEPAVLVMHHSLRPHPAITATLLDFMCRIIPTFYPPLTERVTQGMYTALRQIVKMRVLPSLEPLFINAKLDKELRRLLKERFAEFCASNDGSSSGAAAGVKAEDTDGTGVTASGDTVMTPPVTGDPSPLSAVCGEQDQSADEPAFSDDEDCCEIKPAPAAPVETQPRPATPVNTTTTANLGVCVKQDLHVSEEDVFGEKYSDAWDELVAPLRKQLDKLRHETDSEMRCEAVESICRTVCDGEFSEDTLASLAFCLVANFHSTLTQSVFPPEDQVTPDRLDESVRQPLFVLLRGLCDCSDGHPCRSLLIALVTALCQHSDRVAHLLLYYIVVRTQNDDKDVRDDMFGVYKDMCTARHSDRSLSDQLVEDIQVCVDVEPAMLVWLVPALYSHLPSVCVGNAELLHLVLCRLDGRQLLQLVSHAVRGQLVIFRRDSFIKVIDASLEWETFEQYCLWQLVEAHELTVDYIVPLITRLDCQRHWEAVTALLLMLKREEPCMELMKPLMLRSYDSDNTVGRDQDSSVPQTESNDLLVSSVLLYWVCEYQQQTAELIANLVNRSSLTPNKRKRTTAPRSSPHLPSTELLLQHLDRLRQSLRVAASSSASSANSFWSIDEVQTALSVAQSGCVEVQRQRFAELFALVDVDDDSASRTRRARKAAARGRASAATTTAAGGGGGRGQSSQHRIASAVSSVVDDSSDSEQSTEDEQVKKPSRKRRKNNQLNSDSD